MEQRIGANQLGSRGGIAVLLAHRIVPGADPGRFMVTVVLGMAGAFMGGSVLGVLAGSGRGTRAGWSWNAGSSSGQTVRPPLMGLANGRGVPPVFGFEEEAGLFARLSRRGGRSVLRIGIDEIVSLLCVPLGGVDLVVLDPVSDAEADMPDGSASLTRQRFLYVRLDRGTRASQGKVLLVWPPATRRGETREAASRCADVRRGSMKSA